MAVCLLLGRTSCCENPTLPAVVGVITLTPTLSFSFPLSASMMKVALALHNEVGSVDYRLGTTGSMNCERNPRLHDIQPGWLTTLHCTALLCSALTQVRRTTHSTSEYVPGTPLCSPRALTSALVINIRTSRTTHLSSHRRATVSVRR